ncbi:hypothetical protein ACFFLS_23780 [Flavobacterium procerum]|uniref:Uncharacterized protein n=1 Tax=Flavobacterium procerum TaxID=1455569 RepID=A0ABV6BXD1_9FLAO
MFITLTSDKITFRFKSKQWHYHFDEIKELGLVRRKKMFYLENTAFAAVTAITYYFMIFTNVSDLYYIIPAVLCYTILVIARFYHTDEFVYLVMIKDVYDNEKRIKIASNDRLLIGKQIDSFLELQFNQNIKKTA